MVDAFKLDRYIRIESLTTASMDDTPAPAYGEASKSFSLLANVWAHVRGISGREFFDADQVVHEEFVEFKIRYRSDVNARCRILYNGDYYDIRSVQELGRRDALRIVATVINP